MRQTAANCVAALVIGTVPALLIGLLVFVFLAGCTHHTPFASYQHIDASPMDDDQWAWDVLCGGYKWEFQRLEAKAAWCENLRDGSMIQAGIEYDFIKRR